MLSKPQSGTGTGNRHGGWTNEKGECALLPDEDPVQGSVRMPTQYLYADLRGASGVGEKAPARLSSLTRFLYGQEVAYYDEMKAHLRDLGLKCPITGTNQDFSDASNLANARLDFMARNNYWCHPNVNVKPLRFSNAAMVGAPFCRFERISGPNTSAPTTVPSDKIRHVLRCDKFSEAGIKAAICDR
jgi:hypothetical protein